MSQLKMQHFLDISEIPTEDLRRILEAAKVRKQARAGMPRGIPDADQPLAGHALALVFERPSTRTRVSFHMAIRQLGGDGIVLSSTDLHLGRGETIADTARVLSRYVDAVMIRSDSHAKLHEFAEHASVPVINGLTDRTHPCQIIADIMTIEEHFAEPVAGKTIAWCGDGNNVAHSFLHAAAKLDFKLRLACPDGYGPDPEIVSWAQSAGAELTFAPTAAEAVANADCVVTDAWASMGDEKSKTDRQQLFAPYRVTAELMALAAPHAVFLHCLPAYRDFEVTDAVLEGQQSLVFDEAENRLHAQKAILLWCFAAIE